MIILAIIFLILLMISALANWVTYTGDWVDDRAWHFDWQTAFMLGAIAIVFAPVVLQ